MGRKAIDKTGEEKLNNFGSKMIVKEYRKAIDIDVYFPEYNWIVEHARYDHFKNGNIKCPYEPRICEVGYLGEGKYKVKEDGKHTNEYRIYYEMLRRCYDSKFQEKHPSYKGCTAENDWFNFQNMAEWIENNYYEVPGEKMHLDKDILCKGNKVYSRNTCIFVPQRINELFTKNDKTRGYSPIGVTPTSSGNYQVQCNDVNGERIYLGSYSTKEEAFQVYKEYKERVIKEVIDSYEGKIPEPFYSRLKEAMYNYKVEKDD